MNDSDKGHFLRVMTGLAEIYEMEITEVLLETWFQILSEYDIEAVSSAISRYIGNPDTGMYKPKPAEIIKMLKGNSTDSSFLAWTKLDKAVRMVGTYRTVVFDDPIIHKVVDDMGGWCSFGLVTEDELPFKAKEFQQRYRGYSQRGEIPEHPKKLTGIHSHENFRTGFKDVNKPVFIGDESKAKLILAGTDDKKYLE